MLRPALAFAFMLSIYPFAQSSATQTKNIRPKEFAIIFNMGYAADRLPQKKGDFEKLVHSLKKAHYNVILCKYTDERAAICKKHGLKILVDLLVPGNHIYKNVPETKKLCEKLRNNPTVWGYHLWSDRIGGSVKGRNRDVNNVHTWDPTHPTYVGSYNGRALEGLVNPNAIGFYDFHWRRGGLWRHLFRVGAAARKTDSYFYRYAQPDPGQIGKGNYNRGLYTISVSIAFGLKGYMYHYRGGMLNTATFAWGPLGKDLARINAEIAPLGPELMKIGNPEQVYSTPVTKSAKDRPVGDGKPIIPAGLQAPPKDNWFQVIKGEAVIGVYRDAQKNDVLIFANHNAYQMQKMQIEFHGKSKSIQHFERKKNGWQSLPNNNRTVQFQLPPAGVELIRIERR